MQLLLDANMRDHLSADFAEAAQPVCNLEKPIFIQSGNVAGDIPALAQYFRCLVGAAKITLHDVGTAHQHQARPAGGNGLLRLCVNDTYAKPGQRMANASAFDSDLVKPCRSEIMCIDRHRRRALGASVSLEGPDAKLLLKHGRQSIGKFFRAHGHDAHAAELLRGTPAHVKLQEGRRRQQERDFMVADQLANCFGIQRIGVIDRTHRQHRRLRRRVVLPARLCLGGRRHRQNCQ